MSAEHRSVATVRGVGCKLGRLSVVSKRIVISSKSKRQGSEARSKRTGCMTPLLTICVAVDGPERRK
jgi:hypothetical protein